MSDIVIDIVVNATNPVDPGEFPGGPCRNRENPIPSTNSFTVSGENAVYNPRTGLYTVSVNGVCIDRNTNYTVTISYAPIDGESPPEIYVDKVGHECLEVADVLLLILYPWDMWRGIGGGGGGGDGKEVCEVRHL